MDDCIYFSTRRAADFCDDCARHLRACFARVWSFISGEGDYAPVPTSAPWGPSTPGLVQRQPCDDDFIDVVVTD